MDEQDLMDLCEIPTTRGRNPDGDESREGSREDRILIDTPEEAFPIPQNLPEEAMSSARYSAIINRQSYFLGESSPGANFAYNTRYPEQAYYYAEGPQRTPLASVDPFRWAAGRYYAFSRGSLRQINPSGVASVSTGTPFTYKSTQILQLMGGKEHQVDGTIFFDGDIFNELTKVVEAPLQDKIQNFVFGVNGSQQNPQSFNILNKAPIPDPSYPYPMEDHSFRSPAAYDLVEISQIESSIQDWIDIQPSSNGPDLDILYDDSLNIPYSAYRTYQSSVSEVMQVYPVDWKDNIQKFPSQQIQSILDANQSSLLDSTSRGLMNNHVKISINMHHDSPIAAAFEEYELDHLLLECADKFSPVLIVGENNKDYYQILDQLQPDTGNATNDRIILDFSPRTFDIISFLDQNQQMSIDHRQYVLGVMNHEDRLPSPRLIAFKAKLEELLTGKKRNFSSIMSKNFCHSEVVAYRVEKIKMETNEVMQEFFFFNNQEITTLDFYDSQVKYQEKYIYRVYTINFVVGSTYVHKNLKGPFFQTNRNNPTYNFQTNSRDSFKIIESPYYEEIILVQDLPPLYPSVELLPNVMRRPAGDYDFIRDDLYTLSFTPRIGRDEHEQPLRIRESDTEIIEEMLTRAELGRFGLVSYASDTIPKFYEAIIIDHPPETYMDFSDSSALHLSSSQSNMEVECLPNKDYYALFRARDNGGISNPSEIYKIRINSFPDGRSPEFTTFELEENLTTESYSMVTAERNISIEPAFSQRIVDYSRISSEILNGQSFYLSAPEIKYLSLGSSETKENDKSIWNKKFKFRIKSRSTGKSIDLNICFKQKLLNYSLPLDPFKEEIQAAIDIIQRTNITDLDNTVRATTGPIAVDQILPTQVVRIPGANISGPSDDGGGGGGYGGGGY